MKALLTLLLVVAVFSAAPVLAGVAAEQGGGHHPAFFLRVLHLTPQERQQAMPILRDGRQKLHALDLQTRDAALGALSADHRQRVDAIAAQVRQQLHSLRGSAPAGPSQNPRERWSAMRANVKPIFDQGAQQIDALLTPDESKAVLAKRESMTSQERQIAASTSQQLRPILTAEQQQKLDALSSKMAARAERRGPGDAGRFLLILSMHQKG
ncbi:MAG TPA: hypothetical protein VNJ51_12070 [Candidatus Dormibacteraeota bacterium]|nr:hypothetical protein [Candidatus Dormibacteraeota bacterium]